MGCLWRSFALECRWYSAVPCGNAEASSVVSGSRSVVVDFSYSFDLRVVVVVWDGKYTSSLCCDVRTSCERLELVFQ